MKKDKDFAKFVNIMGFRLFSDSLSKVPLNDKLLLSTISPNSYGISTKDKLFKDSLINSDILVLDGVYFGLGYFLKTGRFIKKNQGPDLSKYFLSKANEKGFSVFFLGSTENTLFKIKEKLKKDFPNIVFQSYSPPFTDEFTENESKKIINKINSFSPTILFVGMTCPKQEKWSFKYKNDIDANLICNIGAVFDWISGNQKEIHPIWWKLRLAWLKRTIDRPEILKRYPNIFRYFLDMFLMLLGVKKF